MSFCLRPNVCKKCGKPLTMFEGWICLECEEAEQKPCDDAISRQAVLDIVCGDYKKDGWGESNFYKAIKQLPSVRPQKQIPEQWQELKETIIELRDNNGTCTQQEVCKFLANYMTVLEKQMVKQEPKTGHWIIMDDCEDFIAKCSECGRVEDSRMINRYPYCHCGAKMKN